MSDPRPDPPDDPGAAPARSPVTFGIDYSKGGNRIIIAMRYDGTDFKIESVKVRECQLPNT